MKKLLIVLLILVIIACVGVITCPGKQAHKEAIMELVNSKLNKYVDDSADEYYVEEIMKAVAEGSKYIESLLDSRLEVKNYFVYSIATVGSYDKTKKISFGLLGHVFTMSKERFNELVDGLN